MNILFVCSRNEWRSRTAETIFKNNGHHQVRSAGTSKTARIKISQKLIDWADQLFVMEKKHRDLIMERFVVDEPGEKIVLLDIPDEFEYMDEELIEMLKVSVGNYFDELESGGSV